MESRDVRGGHEFVAVPIQIREHLTYRWHNFVEGGDILKF